MIAAFLDLSSVSLCAGVLAGSHYLRTLYSSVDSTPSPYAHLGLFLATISLTYAFRDPVFSGVFHASLRPLNSRSWLLFATGIACTFLRHQLRSAWTGQRGEEFPLWNDPTTALLLTAMMLAMFVLSERLGGLLGESGDDVGRERKGRRRACILAAVILNATSLSLNCFTPWVMAHVGDVYGVYESIQEERWWAETRRGLKVMKRRLRLLTNVHKVCVYMNRRRGEGGEHS